MPAAARRSELLCRLRGSISRPMSPGGWTRQTTEASLGCRQNYTILMTDGYWNGPDPSRIGNADRDSFSNTLADVAYHYWSYDLRNDLPAFLAGGPYSPTHQYMVSLGMCLGLMWTIDAF